MNASRCLLAAAAVLCAHALSAQTPNDPISGTWTGHIGPGATPQLAITFELKFDGTKSVSGTVAGFPAPGEIKTGAFAPATGALRLEMGPTGNTTTRLVLEGTVVMGSATGRVSADNQAGTFRIAKGTDTAPQQPNGAFTIARGGFDEVSAWVTKAAETVPADKYSFKPVATVRSFGQLIGHIADSYHWYCGNATGRKVEWADPIEKGNTDKATLAAKLKQATDACNAVYTDKSNLLQLMQNVTHTNLHYGNIITYMRMMGLVPPSS